MDDQLIPDVVVVTFLFQAAASESDDDADEFARMLRRAAMEDRTVIMTSVNEAWAAPGSLLDSFLESFRVGENVSHFVKHIVVVAMDDGAFRRCQAVHPHCHLLRPEKEGLDLSGAKSYMTKDYLDLVWSKLRLQQRILELGYNLLFTARNRTQFIPVTIDSSRNASSIDI